MLTLLAPTRARPRDHELCHAAGVLRHHFQRLVDRDATPPLSAIDTVRADVVAFCRIAHLHDVSGIEIRRQVGRAMRDALPDDCYDLAAQRWTLAAQRLVDEVYLLGEHQREESAAPRRDDADEPMSAGAHALGGARVARLHDPRTIAGREASALGV